MRSPSAPGSARSAPTRSSRPTRVGRARGIPVISYWFNYPAYNTAAAEAAMFNATVGPLQPNEALCGDFEDDPNAIPFPLSAVGLQPLIGVWPLWMADYSTTPDSAVAPAIARQFTNCGSTPGIGGCSDQSRVLRPLQNQWLTSSPGGPPRPTGKGDGMGFLSRDVTGETLDEVPRLVARRVGAVPRWRRPVDWRRHADQSRLSTGRPRPGRGDRRVHYPHRY